MKMIPKILNIRKYVWTNFQIDGMEHSSKKVKTKAQGITRHGEKWLLFPRLFFFQQKKKNNHVNLILLES